MSLIDPAIRRPAGAVLSAVTNAGGLLDVSPATLRWLDHAFLSFHSSIGNLHVGAVTAAMIHKWHQDNLDRCAAVTANSYLRAVKIVFSRLYDQGVIDRDPARWVRYAPQPTARPKAIKRSTYEKLRQAAGVRDRAMVDLAWATGCRLSGLLSMSLDTLDLWLDGDRLCLAVMVHEKAGRPRFVYAADDQAQSLVAYLQRRPFSPSPLIFVTSKGAPLSKPGAQSCLKRLRNKAQLAEGTIANWHSFRHAFAIRMLDDGVDLATVAAWLGHADPAFTARVYAVRSEDQLRAKYFAR